MKKLLLCPECGKLPELNLLKEDFKFMKYFCGTHISCGDWKQDVESAADEWNKRVREFKPSCESEFKFIHDYEYIDGTKAQNGDVVKLTDGSVGFVYYDESIELWNVKILGNGENKHSIQSLKNAEKYIKELML